MRAAIAASAAVASLLLASAAAAQSLTIQNAHVVDGTGGPTRTASVRIEQGRIVEIGRVRPRRGETVVDAQGLTLAPGFIDTHSHHDRGLEKEPEALAAVSQGVTTIIVGQDGSNLQPVDEMLARFEAAPAAVNLASYVGHNSVRAAVLGRDYKRAATPQEVARMAALVEQAMDAGALGLSTGLEYDPGIYSARDEVLALAKAAAAKGGRYISHIRSEDHALDGAIAELIDIGRRTGMPVQISHMKIAIVDRWGQAPQILAGLDAARAQGIEVTADVYPYTYWQSGLDVLLPKRDFTDVVAAQFALDHLARAEDLRLTDYPANPAYVGRTVAEIARLRGRSAARTYLDLITEAQAKGSETAVIGRSMSEEDVADLISWPHANISSDGQLAGAHPRGAGSFPRVFAWLVRDKKRLTLEAAVHKMTGLAADHMGIADRGRIAPGQAADLVLFDPAVIADRSTTEQPSARAVGVRTVWVGGVPVYDKGKATGRRPGRALRRQAVSAPRAAR